MTPDVLAHRQPEFFCKSNDIRAGAVELDVLDLRDHFAT
jgi:hypothetical protein